MVGCVLSQLKPSELYILASKKARLSASALFTAKNLEFLRLYPILKAYTSKNENMHQK